MKLAAAILLASVVAAMAIPRGGFMLSRMAEQSRRGYQFPSGLVAYWSVDGDALDTFASFDFDTVGTPTYTTNAINGQAITGFESGSYLRQPLSSSFNFTDGTNDEPFTISYWLRDTVLGGAFMVAKRSSLFQWNIVYPTDTTRIRVALFGATGGQSALIADSPEGTLNTAEGWVHIVVTYDGSATASGIKIYKNGVALTLDTSASYGAYTSMQVTSARMTIGNRDDGGTLFNRGSFDEIAIWNRALSSNEVSEIYNNGAGRFYTP